MHGGHHVKRVDQVDSRRGRALHLFQPAILTLFRSKANTNTPRWRTHDVLPHGRADGRPEHGHCGVPVAAGARSGARCVRERGRARGGTGGRGGGGGGRATGEEVDERGAAAEEGDGPRGAAGGAAGRAAGGTAVGRVGGRGRAAAAVGAVPTGPQGTSGGCHVRGPAPRVPARGVGFRGRQRPGVGHLERRPPWHPQGPHRRRLVRGFRRLGRAPRLGRRRLHSQGVWRGVARYTRSR